MEIIELIIEENEELSAIEAISLVESPAIEENFIALKNQNQIRLAEVSKSKRLLIGAALIPDKPIYRKSEDHEFYIYFSKETVAKASQMYLKSGNQGQATMEHSEEKLEGITVVESWIIEDEVHDKSRAYGLDLKVGTWMVTIKVDNNDIWENYVQTKKILGFSIEGYFIDRVNNKPKDKQTDKLSEDEILLNSVIDVIQEN
tara:strand:+ start:9330 stop:9935 length:606 start_codon:yes stop_codon:yes gene_type:complete